MLRRFDSVAAPVRENDGVVVDKADIRICFTLEKFIGNLHKRTFLSNLVRMRSLPANSTHVRRGLQ